jgi:hypothetical protein
MVLQLLLLLACLFVPLNARLLAPGAAGFSTLASSIVVDCNTKKYSC